MWLNSIATRTPSLASGRDLGKIGAQAARVHARARSTSRTTSGSTRRSRLPFPHSSVARALNRAGPARDDPHAAAAARDRRTSSCGRSCRTSATTSARSARAAPVYYCVDEWSMFGYLDREQTVAAERTLLAQGRRGVRDQRCARRLRSARSIPNTFESPHGVDHAQFARALAPRHGRARRPRSHAAIRGSASTARCATGSISSCWRTSRAHAPSWQIVLIGQELCDTSAIRGLPNVHLLGQKPHHELPGVLQRLRRRHHSVPHRRAHAVRESAQAARVPVGRAAGRVDAGARGEALSRARADRGDAGCSSSRRSSGAREGGTSTAPRDRRR